MISFLPGEEVEARAGKTLLELAKGIEILSVCGGLGSCGKCKVRVKRGMEFLSEPTRQEKVHITQQDLTNGYRLACQARVIKEGEIEVEVPIASRRGEHVLQVEGIGTPVKLSPSISKYRIRVEPPTLERTKSDHDSLIEALPIKAQRMPLNLLRSLPSRLRGGNWEVDVVVYDDEVISVGRAKRLLGFAVDLGTTKLAGYLLDLETGETLAKVSKLNPQIRYGEDVISRITHVVRDGAMASVLHALLLKAVNGMIGEAVKMAGLSREDVFEVVAVGNTFMHHTFLNLDLSALAMSPYPPAVRAGLTYSARELGLKVGEGGKVYMLPNIAGYVGADCVAAILATQVYKVEGPALMIDIGTNTEIVLNDGEGLYAVSTASGPAFEGAHIKHGMRAMKGAIEGVAIDEGHKVLYRTIGNDKPIGICGSGILDAIAWMARRGIIDRSGRLNDKYVKEGMKAFILVEAERTAIGEDIVVTQQDVREVQKAKAAIATGIKTLLRMRGLRSDELKAIFIAGAFGTYIDPSSAIEIGMLPELPLAKIIQVGNAAGTGARMCLLSKGMKAEAERISRSVQYVELARRPDFQKTFIESIRLTPFKV